MKKLNCLLLGATLACIGMTPVHAQTKIPQVKESIMHKLVEQSKYYMFDRIKTMCSEWPGCEKWALERRKENPSFVIIDAEVEYYVTNSNHRQHWNYNLYVETMENLQTQTYVFTATDDKFNAIPSKFRKFPGHPFTDMPSEHAKYEWKKSFRDHSNKIRQRWPEISNKHWHLMGKGVEQQRVLWDEKNNPLWARRFDYTTEYSDGTDHYAVIARQNKLGEPFKYKYIDLPKENSILIRAGLYPNFVLR